MSAKINLYFISVLLFMLVLPLVSIVTNMYRDSLPFSLLFAGKWRCGAGKSDRLG